MDDIQKINQIEKKIKDLEQDRTLIEFKEHLTMDDWNEIQEINMQIQELEEEKDKILKEEEEIWECPYWS